MGSQGDVWMPQMTTLVCLNANSDNPVFRLNNGSDISDKPVCLQSTIDMLDQMLRSL